MNLCEALDLSRGLAGGEQAQLADIDASDQVVGAASRAPKAPPTGAQPWRPCSPPGIRTRPWAGPPGRRTIEGASTTSDADIRCLPPLPAAEHTYSASSEGRGSLGSRVGTDVRIACLARRSSQSCLCTAVSSPARPSSASLRASRRFVFTARPACAESTPAPRRRNSPCR
jgi:hypothetical protein